ncbi:hypothetical protein [Paenarthrobacter sp. A20]|uniref:hypothetical protein n=1 Tax=Paenarthrobacter sp. A20 TaxID=2817891 RepID=UPI0020A03B3C|nr:hypothetical protein [Paenarthrobacter sp. A20]MCP1414389.1 hypothetical protein [Paenarthrobacter sp. A20]
MSVKDDKARIDSIIQEQAHEFGTVLWPEDRAVIAAIMAPLLNQVRAEVLQEAADELARLPYVRPGAEGRSEYERMLAIRRGNTDQWLKEWAAEIRSSHR